MSAETVAEAAEPSETEVPERILAVDPDRAFLARIVAFARGRLVDVVACAGASEALAEARRQRPDAAFVSTSLPGALELARSLRDGAGPEALPVAFMADAASFEERVAAARAGGSLFLLKPLDDSIFASALQDLLASRAGKARVLLFTDDEPFRERVTRHALDAGLLVARAAAPRELVDQLEKLRPDLVLVDAALQSASALDLCRLVRTTPPFRDLPVALVGADDDDEARLAAFKAGVDDWVRKSATSEELVARLVARLERARLVRERAERDALTGLSTRRAFVELATLRLAEARRHGRALSFALVDLDRFKTVNDERGHLVGDRVLATFGRLLATRFRATDLRGRWGGEEFALVFPDEAAATAQAVLERLLAEASALRFVDPAGETFSMSFSAGIATLPADGSTLEELVRAADRRLYDAKAAGRSRVRSSIAT